MNLSLHDMAPNQIWCALVSLACEFTAWIQLLAVTDHAARHWEPTKLRLRLLSIASRLALSGRRHTLHLSKHSPGTALLLNMLTTLRTLPAPAT